MLIPPVNWGLVERGLSRSGLPAVLNYPFMEKQKIKTIIYLAAEEEEEEETQLEPAFLSFITEHQITLIQLGGKDGTTDGGASASSSAAPQSKVTGTNKDVKSTSQANWKPTSEDLVIAALNSILDPRNYPLHVMCSSSGRHRTGVVIGCFRKLQRWALSSIFAEYRRYAGSSRGSSSSDGNNELMMNEQFIELFDVDLVSNTLAQRHVQKHLKQLNINVANLTGIDPKESKENSLAASSNSGSLASLQLSSAKKSSNPNLLNLTPSNASTPNKSAAPTPSASPSTVKHMSSAQPQNTAPMAQPVANASATELSTTTAASATATPQIK